MFDALLRLPAEGYVIIEVEEIEPIVYVFALGCRLLVELIEIRSGLDVGRDALLPVMGPGRNFRLGVFIFRIDFDPIENLTVAFASGEFLFQRLSINAFESEKTLVERAGEVVFAALSVDRCAALIEHAREDYISAEPDTGAAGRLFGKIGSMIESHNSIPVDVV
jgi:hypothetical protein